MLKQIECKIVESRPLEPCRSISHRQSDNCRQDRYSQPTRPDFRPKSPSAPADNIANRPVKSVNFGNRYALGMVIDILA